MSKSQTKLITRRINPGSYEITYLGRRFTAEAEYSRSEGARDDGSWVLCEDNGETDGYWQTFYSLWECKDAVQSVLDDEAGDDRADDRDDEICDQCNDPGCEGPTSGVCALAVCTVCREVIDNCDCTDDAGHEA